MQYVSRWRQWGTVAGLAVVLLLGGAGADAAAAMATDGVTGTLTWQRHGDHGRPVILIPGLQGGPWVWQDTIEHLAKDHVVYAVTLAGFDGVPAPQQPTGLMDQADAALAGLIAQQQMAGPVLVGHSLGGTLALRFAGEHARLIAGVVAVDGLPIFPGMERLDATQRRAMAQRMRAQMAGMDQAQFAAAALGYMQRVGVIDPQLAAKTAPLNARSDIAASAGYAAEDLAADYRPQLRRAGVPILEIMPYNAPDMAAMPQPFTAAQKLAYYQSLVADAPDAKVVMIAPARHFVMLDQPEKFRAALDDFLRNLENQP